MELFSLLPERNIKPRSVTLRSCSIEEKEVCEVTGLSMSRPMTQEMRCLLESSKKNERVLSPWPPSHIPLYLNALQ